MYDWPEERGCCVEEAEDVESNGMKKKSARILTEGKVAYINDSIGNWMGLIMMTDSITKSPISTTLLVIGLV